MNTIARRAAAAALTALTLTTLTTLTALAGPASAAAPVTRWASPAGSGTACSQATPCALVTALGDDGLVTPVAGDEVVVTPGTYSVGQLQTDVQLDVHGQAGQAVPTIDFSDPTYGFLVYGGARVHDLHLTSATTSVVLRVGSNAGAPVLDRLSVSAPAAGGIGCDIADNATLRDSVCWAPGTNGIGLRVAVNTATTAAKTITLRNVTALGALVGIDADITGPPTYLVDARSVIARGGGSNDVTAEAHGGAAVNLTFDHSSYATTATTVAAGSSAAITEPGTGTNQQGAPVFVDAAAGDFRQAAGSPTIDAGAVDGSSGTLDPDGDPRTVRGLAATACPGLPDIGADEYVSPFDCTAPDTTVTGPASTTDPTPTFVLGSTDPGSTFECKVDGGDFTSCASPFTTAALALGSHTIQARATDLGGNVDPTPASTTVTILAPAPPAPDTTITSGPAAKVTTRKRKATLAFVFTSDRTGTTFECSVDAGAYRPCTSPATVRLGKGRHTFSVRAKDVNGVVDPTPATRTIKVRVKRSR